MKRLTERLAAYFALTKPTINLLVVVTGAAGLVLEGGYNADPLRFGAVLLLLSLASGSASALNQYIERERDARMARNRFRRPLPSARIGEREALVFALALGIAAVTGFLMLFTWLAAALSAATILFYALFYTIYLKPRTHWNIVIGGAAGAMGPGISWAASAGSLAWTPFILFAIIFFWMPPHFWALALCLRDDYIATGLPMLPLVVGESETWKRIMRYTRITLAFTAALAFTGPGPIYAVAAVVLGVLFILRAATARRTRSISDTWKVFGYSIVYLLALFTFLIVDHGITLF